MEIQSVNWCSKHRIQFPCDQPCPQCGSPVIELNELVCRMETNISGRKLWAYGTILEYCKKRLRQLKSEL